MKITNEKTCVKCHAGFSLNYLNLSKAIKCPSCGQTNMIKVNNSVYNWGIFIFYTFVFSFLSLWLSNETL